VALVVIAFAIANRHQVTLSLDPLPYAFELPLFTVAFAGILIGLCVGGFAAWMRAGRWRQRARQEHRLASQLSRDLETSRSDAAKSGGEGRSVARVA
jgi:uncharacterized integral membrane protein